MYNRLPRKMAFTIVSKILIFIRNCKEFIHGFQEVLELYIRVDIFGLDLSSFSFFHSTSEHSCENWAILFMKKCHNHKEVLCWIIQISASLILVSRNSTWIRSLSLFRKIVKVNRWLFLKTLLVNVTRRVEKYTYHEIYFGQVFLRPSY